MRWCGQQESSTGFSGRGNSQIHKPLAEGWDREYTCRGRSTQKQEYGTVNLGFVQALPDDPFPLPTQGQPPHWLTPPQAKPVLATATDNQQGSWLTLAIPFLFHLVGEWTLLAESYGEEKLIPPTSGTD